MRGADVDISQWIPRPIPVAEIEWDGTVREATAYDYGEFEARNFSQFDAALHRRRHGTLA